MNTPTPSPAPQQWAKPYTEIQELAQAIRLNLQDDACPYVQDDKWVITAAAHALVILDNVELATKHAAALSEENERLKREVEHQRLKAENSEKLLLEFRDRMLRGEGEFITMRLWSEQAREVVQGIINGCVHPDVAVRRISVDLAPLRTLLQSHPAATNLTEEGK